jgi:hypothetical protein
MRTINGNLHPKDGYWFQDADGVRHVDTSWKKLIARVTAYRKRRGIPEGNVKDEVNAQACERMPSYCGERQKHTEKPRMRGTFKTTVIHWLSQKSRDAREGSLTYVKEAEAQARREVCAKCPLKTDLKGVCSPCDTAMSSLRKVVAKGRREVWGGYNACSVLGIDLPTAILLSEAPSDNKNLPAECWRRPK